MAYQDVRARLEHIDLTTISRYKYNADGIYIPSYTEHLFYRLSVCKYQVDLKFIN